VGHRFPASLPLPHALTIPKWRPGIEEMKRHISFCAGLVLLGVGFACLADVCQLRSSNAQTDAIYSIVSRWPASKLRLLVDEFTYRQKWILHRDAVQSGFRYGDVVFGETLVPQGIFNPAHVGTWRSEYANEKRKQYVDEVAPQLVNHPVDRDLVGAVLNSCLRPDLWNKLVSADDCRFTFTVGVSASRPIQQVLPLEFSVGGGRCETWPNRPVDTKGQTVQCVRSGNGSVTLDLTTTHGVTAHGTLPPLKVRADPREPMLEQGAPGLVVEIFTLYRARDYQAVGFGQSCPSCKLFAADFHPSRPDAVIVDVSIVSSGDTDRWLRCPASYRCGTPEFSPPDQRNVSGCTGLRTCRVWRLANEDVAGWDTIQVTSTGPASICRNCPDGMDYAAAHKQWEEDRRARGLLDCDVFPDPPAQAFRQHSEDRTVSPVKR